MTVSPSRRRPRPLHLAVCAVAVLVAVAAWSACSDVQRFTEPLALATAGELPPAPAGLAGPDRPAGDVAVPVPDGAGDRIGPDVVSYLVFSTGSDGMTAAQADRFGVADLDQRGSDRLTDVMLLVLLDPPSGSAAMLSIPRDTWVASRQSKVNAVYVRHGAQAMVDAVGEVTGLPVHHLVEVNFAAFGELVGAIGGVPLQVDVPLRDLHSGLWLPDAGCVLLDPVTALGYVRSRHTESQRADGTWGTAPVSTDFGRTLRQRQFLAAAWNDLRGPQLVGRIPALWGVLTRNVTVDAQLGLTDIVGLARTFQGVGGEQVESYGLPGTVGRVGAASVVHVDPAAAGPILSRLRNWPPDPAPASPTAGPGPTMSARPSAPPMSAPAPGAQPPPPPGCTRDTAHPAPGTHPPGLPPAPPQASPSPTAAGQVTAPPSRPAGIPTPTSGPTPSANPTPTAAATPTPSTSTTPTPTATPSPSAAPSPTTTASPTPAASPTPPSSPSGTASPAAPSSGQPTATPPDVSGPDR